MSSTSLLVGSCLCLTLCQSITKADTIDDYLRAEMQAQHIPGVSIAVLKHGVVEKAQGYGYANIELNVQATADTVYEIGSLTKQFTSALVLMLVEDKRVGLDDEISKYLIDIPETWKKITVRQLLTHTSGIKNYTDLPNFMKLTVLPAKHEDVITSVATAPLDFTPGHNWSYSNTGYYLLGMILEKASGKSYSELLSERIFKPLNMNASRVNDLHDVVTNRASGYDYTGGIYRNAESISMTWPFSAGAIITNVVDLGKWDAALYTDKLLKQQARTTMWSPVSLTGGKSHPYGLGWMIDAVNGHRCVEHGGGIPGFTTHILRFPDDGLTVIVLTNTIANPAKIAAHIAGLVNPILMPAKPKPVADHDPKVTQLLSGIITEASNGKVDRKLFTESLGKLLETALTGNGGAQLKMLGHVKQIALLEHKVIADANVYRYKIEFEKANITATMTLDKQGLVSGLLLAPQ